MSATVLEFKNVSCVLGSKRAVSNVSFTINQGEVICLLGPSGCGKTTNLRLAAGLEKPDAGEIWLDGLLVSSPTQVTPPEKRGLGFLFQDYALFPHLSVYENVCFGIRKQDRETRRVRAENMLMAVGLKGFGDKYPALLSGGEQQRVALARALAPQPRLVLMDEPFSGLDQSLRDSIRDLTKNLLQESGASGLIVTHDAADALRLADRIAVQQEGKIVQIAQPQEIYQHPATSNVARLFGGVNIMDDADKRVGFRPVHARLSGAAEDFTFTASATRKRHIGVGILYALDTQNVQSKDAIEVVLSEEIALNEPYNFYVSRAQLMLF